MGKPITFETNLADFFIIQNSQTRQDYVFRILLIFTTKLCTFTNFVMLSFNCDETFRLLPGLKFSQLLVLPIDACFPTQPCILSKRKPNQNTCSLIH